MLTLGEFREFTADMHDSTEIRIESIFKPTESFHGPVHDISGFNDVDGNFLILQPKEVYISDGDQEMAVSNGVDA